MVSTKHILYIVALLLALGILAWVYFSGRASGKRAGSVNISAPSSDNSNPVSTDEVKRLAERLYNDLDGVNAFGHDVEPYQQLLTLSDNDFIRVYNAFNLDFQKKSGQTFKQWLEAEVTWIQIGSKWPVLRDAILQRMNKLNLK